MVTKFVKISTIKPVFPRSHEYVLITNYSSIFIFLASGNNIKSTICELTLFAFLYASMIGDMIFRCQCTGNYPEVRSRVCASSKDPEVINVALRCLQLTEPTYN